MWVVGKTRKLKKGVDLFIEGQGKGVELFIEGRGKGRPIYSPEEFTLAGVLRLRMREH